MDLKELKNWTLENILNLSAYWKKKAIDILIDSISESEATEAIMHKETEIEAIIYDNKIETLEDYG